jgi:sugar diacid utilization regulator
VVRICAPIRVYDTCTQVGPVKGGRELVVIQLPLRPCGSRRVQFLGQLPADAAPGAVERMRVFAAAQTDPPWVAAGNPLPDVEGFRRSHQLAQEAHAVAIASGANARRVTTASDPGLAAAALMGSNLDTARVWVAEVLGPLASCTENDERLRETLGVFLRTGGSFKAAAEELHLHSNSVKYRVQRAIDRRGRPISDGRLDIELALLLCHWYGSAVLHDE